MSTTLLGNCVSQTINVDMLRVVKDGPRVMSTTPSDGVKENEYHAVWGEPDDGVKVRHAKGGPLYEMGVKIWGWIRGKSMAGGFKVEGVYKNCNM